MDARAREQRRVHRVIGMMMTEHNISHTRTAEPVRAERRQQRLPRRDHARVHDDDDVAVGDQRDRS
jgi:hypothetical protein